MILCKCGKVFSNAISATDHLSVISLFHPNGKEVDRHGVIWQDGERQLTSDMLTTIVYANFEFISQVMKSKGSAT